jgi:thioesterase domain-containing protein
MADRFSELGGDSIKALQLFTAVEERLDVSLPISLLFGDPTVAQMAAAVGQDESEFSADPVIVPIREAGNRPPVFFTHGVQGGLIWLKHVAPLLDPDLRAYGLQAVGLQSEAEPDRSIEAMATRYVEAMRRVQPAGPYYLAGFCFGGVLAYEVARQLEELGERTGLLAVIDGFPPRVFHRKRALVDPLRVQAVRQSAPHWVRGYEAFGGLRLRERLQERLGTGSAAEGDGPLTPATNGNFAEPLDPATATSRRHQQLTQINEQAGDTYMPRPYGGEVTLLRAELLGVRQALFGHVDPMRGWGSLAAGGVNVRTVEGSHVGMLSPPFVTSLAAQLNDALRAAMLVNS